MPHVASQMRFEELFIEPSIRKQPTTIPKKFVELQRPTAGVPIRRRKLSSNATEAPNLSLLIGMPDNQTWDFGSIRHIRQSSSPSDAFTPDSAVESVFELPSAEPVDSPNSSIYPSFAIELEDTSSIAVSKISRFVVQVPFVAPLSVTKKAANLEQSFCEKLSRPEFSMRAAVAIENITKIETDNRLLLERAIAAEEAAKLLREKNQSLQHRIDYCVNLHRPKTAPENRYRAVSEGNLMSAFNEVYKSSLQQTPKTPPLFQAPQSPDPPDRQRTNNLKPLPQLSVSPVMNERSNPFYTGAHNRSQSTPQTPTPVSKRRPSPLALSQPLLSPQLNHDLASSPFATIAFPANPHPARRTRPGPVHTSRSYTKLSSIGTPIPGTVHKHAVTFEGVPLSSAKAVQTISLAEAQRRGEKPLPPNGPMSPSAVPGRVEMGNYHDFPSYDEEKKKKRGLRVLFGWGKKNQSF